MREYPRLTNAEMYASHFVLESSAGPRRSVLTTKRRLLVVTSDPPPTSSGLGTFWAKLSLGAAAEDFCIDFLGPDPEACSPQGPSGLQIPGQTVALGTPPLSRRASVGRNRERGLRRLAWSAIRAPFVVVERRWDRVQYEHWIWRSVKAILPAELKSGRYDAVAALAPPLKVPLMVCQLARSAGVPYVHIVGDPIGWRKDDGTFEPGSPSDQELLLTAAKAILISKPTFERYYRPAFALGSDKVVFVGDLYLPGERTEERKPPFIVPQHYLLHWGQVAPWRSIDGLVDAIAEFNRRQSGVPVGEPVGLAIIGAIVDKQERVRAAKALGPLLQMHPLMAYLDARAVARTAWAFVVVVSPRHRDNVPAKLIDALAYGRPILLLAHPESEAASIVRRLGVGVVADVGSVEAIVEGIGRLREAEEDCQTAYRNPQVAEEWSCSAVGVRVRQGLFKVLGWRG